MGLIVLPSGTAMVWPLPFWSVLDRRMASSIRRGCSRAAWMMATSSTRSAQSSDRRKAAAKPSASRAASRVPMTESGHWAIMALRCPSRNALTRRGAVPVRRLKPLRVALTVGWWVGEVLSASVNRLVMALL